MAKQFLMTEQERTLWASEGWSLFFNTDSNALEVMRIDDPENWPDAPEDGPFPPLLKNDLAATRRAKKYLVLKGFKVLGRKPK